MWPLLILTVQAAQPASASPPASQPITPYQVLAAENQRDKGVPVLLQALASADTVVQRLAARAVGRLRDGALAPRLEPLLRSPAVSVRVAAIDAGAAMGTPFWTATWSDSHPAVRAAMFAALGHLAADSASERRLRDALASEPTAVQRGVVRGIEGLIRRHARDWKPSAATVDALRRTVRDTQDGDVRLIALLALTGARDRDSTTVAAALRDRDPEVRRAAVALGRVWVDDAHPMVRWQALSVAPTCARAVALTRDTSEHVALLALDQLGTQNCAPSELQPWLRAGTPWRHRAHATLALARVDRPMALQAIRALATDPVWQARAWAAQAARVAKDSATLAQLARDANPNVVVEALTSHDEAVAALSRDHAGVLRAAALLLQKQKSSVTLAEERQVRAAFDRISAQHNLRWRDARVELIKVTTSPAAENLLWLADRLRDADPDIVSVAEQSLSGYGYVRPREMVRSVPPPPMPSAAELAALDGATATIRFRGKGTVVMTVDVEQAPVAVATFARMARAGRYTGNTIHRIVPNFVVQGGSPGANEYDPVTPFFMRDEVGGENRRGTFGVSTRGYDTGDGQLYINLIYNLRLDGDYTVFGVVTRGLDVVDRIQEGDVIESITIAPRSRSAR
jgi:cyclophilin family peptidyl-prolyl cis-trans isomerase